MITEKYCNEILQQYPEYITKDQMYRICHISKKTCLFLLESGLVPNIDSGKKTRRFKIKTVDVIQYLKDRDDYPELFKAPDGFYKGKGGDTGGYAVFGFSASMVGNRKADYRTYHIRIILRYGKERYHSVFQGKRNNTF